MPDRARRKEKQRLKRKQKRRELNRIHSISPYRRAAQGELLGCWINHDWRERGQAGVWVLRRGLGGTVAFAMFFIDLWCAGLKDAWGRAEALREEFDEGIDRSNEVMDDTMAPCTLDLARQIVAGAIRFARQNGFRLAERYDRWTAFLGPPLDWQNASLDDFGVDGGKLRWVAPMEDLKARYIGGPVEDFLARDDVEFIFDGEGTFFDELEEDEEPEDDLSGMETFKRLSEIAADDARKWCVANGLEPELLLVEAMAFSFAALLMGLKEGEELPSEAEFRGRLKELIGVAPVEKRNELIAACAQAQAYVRSFDSPQAFLKSFPPPQ